MEGAGVVTAVGADVKDISVGDRIVYAMVPGGYAEQRLLPASRAIRLPDDIPDDVAAGILLQGLTARALLRETYRVQQGDVILVHAAAGGVGTILCQWASSLGATVIGTVSSDEKAAYAAKHGCQHPVIAPRENFVERVAELTQGKLLPVVYDSIGKDTFAKSLDCLRPRGLLVVFGQSSGKVPDFDPAILGTKGSLYLTRMTLASYIASRDELVNAADDLLQQIRSGVVTSQLNQRFPLRDAAEAHRALGARRTTGSTILTV
jgi:NADPH2:quinone reductase